MKNLFSAKVQIHTHTRTHTQKLFWICQELHLWQDAEDFISTKSYVLGEKIVFNYFKMLTVLVICKMDTWEVTFSFIASRGT